MQTRIRTLSTLSALLLAIALSGCGKSPEQHLTEGKTYYEKADYTSAILELKSTLQKQPDNRDARFLLGKAYLAINAYAEAEKELSKARAEGIGDDLVLADISRAILKQGQANKVLDIAVPPSGLSPKSIALLHETRAEAFMALGKREQAESELQAASQADSKLPQLLLFKARLAFLDDHKGEARQLIDTALQQDAKNIDGLYMKAATLQQDRQSAEATGVYQQILTLDPKQFRAHLFLSQIQAEAGKMDDAEKSLAMAEKVAGNVPLVKYSRGVFELRRGKLKEANDALLQVLKVVPDHQPSILAQAIVSYGLGNIELSLKNAQRILARSPDNAMAIRVLAASQLKMGDAKGALATLSPLLKPGLDDPQLLNLAAEVYYKNNDFNKAMAYLDRAVSLDPKNPALKTRQAVGHLQVGDEKQALADLEQATKLSDKPGKADLALVILHLQQKHFDAALAAIDGLDKKLPNNPLTHNLRSAAYLGMREPAKARRELESALAIQPTFIPAAMGLARLDLLDKRPADARKRFESVLSHDKSNLEAMLALSDLARVEKQEGEFVKWLDSARKSHPEALQSSDHLIRYYLAKKDKNKALEIAKDALKANPESNEALILLGSTETAAGNTREAIANFNTLVEKNKNAPNAYYQLAIAQIADKQFGAARSSLNSALKLKSDFAAAQDALIQLELSDKNPEAALQVARQMQQASPKAAQGYMREGEIHLIQKRLPQAIKAYETAQAKDPGGQRLTKLHEVLTLAGNGKAADKLLSDWLSSHPQDMIARNYAASAYQQANRNREAIAQYEFILKATPDNAAALNNLADLYQKEKDGRAQTLAEQALKLSPEHPGIMDTLGWILVEKGDLARATPLLRKAVEKAPKVAVLRYHLGVALSRSGDKAGARKELDAAIASGQQFPELENAKALLKTL